MVAYVGPGGQWVDTPDQSQGAVTGAGNGAAIAADWPMRLPTVMSSPPTVTSGTGGAGTAISGSVLVLATDKSAFRYLGGPAPRGINYPGYLGVQLGYWGPNVSRAPTAVEFYLDTSDSTGRFEIYTGGNGNGYRIMLQGVDGGWQRFSATATRTLPNDGNLYLDLVTLGAAGQYLIRIEFTGNSFFYGLRVTPTTVVRAGKRRPVKVVVGDSFSEPTITNIASGFEHDGWTMQLGHLTGWDVWTCSRGGSGYVETVPNQPYKFRNRLPVLLANAPADAEVIFAGGINDTLDDPADFRTEVAGCFADVRAAGRKLWALSPFWPVGDYPIYVLNFRDILKDECAKAGGTFVDLLDMGIPDFLAADAAWQGALTTAVSSGSNIIVDTVPTYFAGANTGSDAWWVKIGSGVNQVVRRVNSRSGTGPYTLGLSAAISGTTFPIGTLVRLAGPGYLTGTGTAVSPNGSGSSDRMTGGGADITHPTLLGCKNIAYSVAAQISAG